MSEEKKLCKSCGKEISEEEFEENHGLCDDCDWDEMEEDRKRRKKEQEDE